MQKPYTKKHWKKLTRILPKKECNICGVKKEDTFTKRLVWDHCHTSGFIRGVLCDICNSWLYCYEEYFKWNKDLPIYSNSTFQNVYGQKIYLWVVTYRDKIEEHLKSNTGIQYSDKITIHFDV